MINDLVEQAERSWKIIANLLGVAREQKIDTHPYQIDDILKASLQLFTSQLKISKVKIERRFSSNLAPISGDKQQLDQVFLNLVLDAKVRCRDGGTLAIETGTIREGGFFMDRSDLFRQDPFVKSRSGQPHGACRRR